MKDFKYDVVQLIHAVRDRPCLWDKTIDNYKDRVDRRNAWEEIFNILEERYEEMTAGEKRFVGDTILNKWTNVRDTFIKSLKPALGRPKKKYIFYDHLKFLTKHRSEECTIDQNDYMNESNEEGPYVPMKQEDETFSNLSEENCEPENILRDEFGDSNDFSRISASHNQKKKSKRKNFEELKETSYGATQSSRGKKNSKRFSLELNESRDDDSVKKSKTDTIKELNDNEDLVNDINFVEFNEADNPRVMNEDEAFFASLLPTVVRYNEDERLEFRIEVLKVMKKIKNDRKCFVD